LYSHLRFAIAASLIAVGVLIGVGGMAFLPWAAEQPLIANGSSGPAVPWMPVRGPRIASAGPSNPVALGSAHNKTAEPVTEGQSAIPGPQVSVARESVEQETSKPAAAFQAAALQNPVPQTFVAPPPAELAPAQPSNVTEPAQETYRTPTPRPAAAQPRAAKAKERHTAKPAVDAQTARPALRKTARRDRTAKPPTSEALNAVRSFGDNLRDIPVSSYAADGTSRRIVIRPTSIQDVYYYSR
jgi:hypothetical protein